MKTNTNCAIGAITKPSEPRRASANQAGRGLATCALACLTMGLLWAESAAAFSVTPISQGQTTSGQTVGIALITLNPGESAPWHYHTGTAWVTVVSGTLTFDEGCGTALRT